MRTSLQNVVPSTPTPGETLARLVGLRSQALDTGVAVIDLNRVRDDIAKRLIADEARRQIQAAGRQA